MPQSHLSLPRAELTAAEKGSGAVRETFLLQLRKQKKKKKKKKKN